MDKKPVKSWGFSVFFVALYIMVLNGLAFGQVTPGTVSSKTLDGVGNKITSTVTGPSRGLDVNCLAGCAGGSGGNGAILDFVNALIGATVRDYVNSNPLAVQLTDSNGDAVVIGSGGTSSTFGAAFPATGTAAGFSDGTPNMRPGFAVDGDTGAGTQYVQGVNLVFRSAGGPIEAGIAANPIRVDPTGTTIQPVSGTVAVSNAFLLDATFTGRINTLGQKTMANSTPVVLASDQTSIPVAATVSNAFLLDATFTGRLPVAYVDADGVVNQTTTAIHGQGYFYNGATWDRMRGTIAGGLLVNISNASLAVTGTFFQATQPISAVALPLPTGAATEVTLATLLTTAAFQARINTLGQKTMANSTPVVLSSDQTAIPVTLTSTTITGTVTVQGAKTNNNAAPGATNVGVLPCVATAAAPAYTEGNQVGCSTNLSGAARVIEQNFVATANNDGACPSGAASFTAIASNASRTWLAVWASPANTDDVYLKLGATATSADARFAPGQPLNFTAGRIYTGIIDAFPASGTQAVCVMELN